jgi:hypothetical protein
MQGAIAPLESPDKDLLRTTRLESRQQRKKMSLDG